MLHHFERWATHACLVLFLASGLCGVFASPVIAASLSQQVRENISGLLAQQPSPPLLTLAPQKIPLSVELFEFYRENGFRPGWVGDFGTSSMAKDLLAVLESCWNDGLIADDYHVSQIRSLLEFEKDARRYQVLQDANYLARLDILLTDAFLRYATHLTAGRVDPNAIYEGEWKARPRRANVVQLLRFSLEKERVAAALQDMQPAYPGYARLRLALQSYRELELAGGWPVIPDGPVVRPGQHDQRVSLLRQRLLISGDLVPDRFETLDLDNTFVSIDLPLPEGDQLESKTTAALRLFQSRHGLQDDGVLGPKTLEALNVPVSSRIRQLELNLERWRWLPKVLGNRYILVNIADFHLFVVEQGHTVLEMPVVVGTAYRKTPVFSDEMTYIEFAPYWGVPETILEEDKLPQIRRNVQFLDRNHFEIVAWNNSSERIVDPRTINWRKVGPKTFPGFLRQKPGPWNALGHVKFMFPNEFDVYLHDTPDRHLFSRDRRSFSSGCIRIERPLDLAQYLLEGSGQWTCDVIQDLMDGFEPKRVTLPKSLPVHILYWTAWVDEQNRVQFREDIYERDATLNLALYGVQEPKVMAQLDAKR